MKRRTVLQAAIVAAFPPLPAPDPWRNYTPTISYSDGTHSSGSGRYRVAGKTVHVEFTIPAGRDNMLVSLPRV